MLKEEERVQEFLKQSRSDFDDYEFDFILDGFGCIRQVVNPDMYSEVLSELVISVLSRRENSEEMTLDAVINDAVKNLELFKKEKSEHEVVHLRELNSIDASYDAEDSTRRAAINRVYEGLKCTKSTQNQIFIDILSGVDRNVIARNYRLTRSDVDRIYEERLGFVKEILIVNDDVLIEDIESRGPIQSNVKRLTDSNK